MQKYRERIICGQNIVTIYRNTNDLHPYDPIVYIDEVLTKVNIS